MKQIPEEQLKRLDSLVKLNKLLDTIDDREERRKIIECEIECRREENNATTGN